MPLAKVAGTGTTPPRLWDALTKLASEIQTAKTAAPTPKDPGGYAGASSHPTADVDNHGQNASEGSRSSENTADVKADIGKRYLAELGWTHTFGGTYNNARDRDFLAVAVGARF